ncbi:hypothetical protein X729_24980 [Mesorhizobium sp. L103C131B0]|nr:hypothetical protein X729_24980 [Mesorhizobium sp. L103C131B0]
MFQLGEEALDQITLAVEPFAESRFPAPIAFRWDVGRCTLLLDQGADAIRIVGLVAQHDGAGAEVVEQLICDLTVMRLSGGQAEPDGKPLRIDNDVDFRREPAARSTETVIWPPFFAVAACWWARTEVLSIIWMSPSCAEVMAPISRSHTPAFRHRTKRVRGP